MESIMLVAGLIAVTFIGFNILLLVMGKIGTGTYFSAELLPENRCLSLFYSYGIGVGFISLEMLVFYLLGLKFTIHGLLAPWTVLVAVNAFRYFVLGYKIALEGQQKVAPGVIARANPEAISKNRLLRQPIGMRWPSRHSLLTAFLIFGISLEAIYALFRALIKPIESYDAIAIYAIKSKIFFIARAIPEGYFSSLAARFPHPDYPLNIPLAETFFYVAMGSLNDQLVKIMFPLFFLGILALLYFAIRRFASSAYALLFTFVLASIPQFNAYAANAYQELPLAFYYFASALSLFAWIEDRKDVRPLILSAIMVALSGWTKNEGLMYCVINTIFVLFFSMTARKDINWKILLAPIAYIAVIGLLLAPWIWVKHRFGIVNDEINLANLNPVYLLKQVHKLAPILYELQKQLFGPKKWIILWPVVIAAGAFGYRKVFKGPQRYISVSVILALCGYVLFYMISYVDVVFFASKTWGRFLLHILPLIVLWLAYILKEDVNL